jgi:trehalose-6-phosphatase
LNIIKNIKKIILSNINKLALLILHDQDAHKLSHHSLLKIHKAAKDIQRYRDKNIYLFKPENVDLSKKIYKKILQKNKDSKFMSVLFLGNDYEDAKKIYRDILISWFA